MRQGIDKAPRELTAHLKKSCMAKNKNYMIIERPNVSTRPPQVVMARLRGKAVERDSWLARLGLDARL